MSILKNRTVLGIICIALSLVICFAVTPLFNSSLSKTAKVVRLTTDVPEGTQITDGMAQTVEVGSHNLPDTIIFNTDSVVGKYATADLFAGDYVLTAKLADAPAAENEYLYSLDGIKQAMSVTIKAFANGLSGKLQSGDIVSVMVPDYEGTGTTVTPPELQYVEIISVTASTGFDANTGKSSGDADEKELPSTVTFLVSAEQSKVLAELELDSKLHLALVYRGDTDSAAEFVAAQDELITALYAEPDIETESAPAESEAAE